MKQHEYKGTQQVLQQILLYMHILKKVVELLQQASFDSWLSYPTMDTTCKSFVAHESTNHQHNTPPWILSRQPTRGPSAVLTLILRLLVVSIYLSMNCISDQVVLYRGRGYSNSFIPCRGVLRHTRSHHLSSLHDVYSATFKRKPNVGVGHSLPKHSSL